MSDADVELVIDARNRCGEAPLWDPRGHRLLWTDIPADTVCAFDPSTQCSTVVSKGLNVSGIALNQNNSLLFAGATGLHLFRFGTSRSIVTEHGGRPLVFNDILAAPHGRLYAGTVYWGADMERTGHLYLVEPPDKVRVVDDDIELANGLALSPDNRTLYFADSAARCIYAYDVDRSSGSLGRKRRFAGFAVEDGIPDGLTTDCDGFVYCAMWYGSQILRLDPDGRVERRVRVPAVQTSSIAFGGKDFTDLYVTSAGEPWPSRLAPTTFDPADPNMGGALYRLQVDVPGRTEITTAF
jgi:D-xylonolactonase